MKKVAVFAAILCAAICSRATFADRNKLDMVGTVIEVQVFTGSLGVEKVWIYERNENPYEQLIRIQCDPSITLWCSDPANFLPGALTIVTMPDPSLPSVRTITTYVRADGGDGYCYRVNGYLDQTPMYGALPIGGFVKDTTCAIPPTTAPRISPPVVCGVQMVLCGDGYYRPTGPELQCFKDAKSSGMVRECTLGISNTRGYCY